MARHTITIEDARQVVEEAEIPISRFSDPPKRLDFRVRDRMFVIRTRGEDGEWTIVMENASDVSAVSWYNQI